MKEYKKLHIIKHALELYVERGNVSEIHLAQEKKVLAEIVEEIERMKLRYRISDKCDES